MSTAWTPALIAETIVLDTQPRIRVKTRSGHLVGYFADVLTLTARLTNLGYTLADVDIKEKAS